MTQSPLGAQSNDRSPFKAALALETDAPEGWVPGSSVRLPPPTSDETVETYTRLRPRPGAENTAGLCPDSRVCRCQVRPRCCATTTQFAATLGQQQKMNTENEQKHHRQPTDPSSTNRKHRTHMPGHRHIMNKLLKSMLWEEGSAEGRVALCTRG